MILLVFLGISTLSLGIISQVELASLADPSLASVMGAIVGDWGRKLIAGTLVLSILGALLTWSVVCSEVPFEAAKVRWPLPLLLILTLTLVMLG